MKRRFEGRVVGGEYVVAGPDGGIALQLPMNEARQDAKLRQAIERNGWEEIPHG